MLRFLTVRVSLSSLIRDIFGMAGDFETLSGGIFVRRSDESASLPIVIIFGWMGGEIRYVKKYADLYEGHLVVIVTGDTSDFIRAAAAAGFQHVDNTLRPLMKLLTAEGCFAGSRRCFLHAFSNGGCLRLWGLQRTLYSSKAKRLDVIGICIDSAPTGSGQKKLTDGVTAFTASIRSPFWRSVARPFVAACLIFLTFITTLLGVTPWHVKTKDALMYDKEAPKLFIFSKVDKLVNWQGIESVIEELKTRGHVVEKILFDDSEHVKHLIKHPSEYAEAVKRLLSR